MGAKNKVTVSVRATTKRPTSAERRSAEIASLSTVQAKLKQEATDRRQKRSENPAAIPPRKAAVARRRNAR
jgi:hypothetical protein